MSKERWVVSELEKRYGVETTRRWLAKLANLQLIGDSMADDIDRLADLLDVLLTNPQDGDTLRYDAIASRWKNGSGGSIPARNVGQTELDFSGLVVNSATVPVPFTFGNGDATMIDLTDPAVPKPVAAGIYAYMLIVSQTGGGDGAAFTATLVVDDDFYSITEIVGHEPQSVGQGHSGVGAVASVTWFCTAGSPFHVHISELGNDSYFGTLFVQKIA